MELRIIQILLLAAVTGASSVAFAESERWPTNKWETATPESQNIDVMPLDQLDREFASGKHGNIDSMSVYRDGYLVYAKAYTVDYEKLFIDKDQTRWQYNYYDPDWHPRFKGGQLHTMQSVSKSVTSALIGIAIGRGEIPDVNVEVKSYFDDYDPVDSDPRRDTLKLVDLLTMTSGIKWDEWTVTYTDAGNSCAAMEHSDDWIRFILDQPMQAVPGEQFNYNSGNTVLLAHILWKATGKHADEYAREHLFGPLGIDNFYWKKTPTGLIDTEGGLYLMPEDLAKFGYLYSHDGVWNQQRILPKGWVAASLPPDTKVPDRFGQYGYGYQWWLISYEGEKPNQAYFGRGYGGQYLMVVPEYMLIAVFTGWNVYGIPALNPKFALDQILKSVR